MNILSFKTLESPESNDHQIRILIDGKDWLGDEYLGLDPPSFFKQPGLLSGGKTVVGRCCCGCEGCDDIIVNVEVTGHSVIWWPESGINPEFVLNQYLSTLESQKNDNSWEDINRKVERLVSEVFEGKVLKGNYSFKWASARIDKGKIKLSFEGGYDQKLFEIPWDSLDTQEAVAKAKKAINEIDFYE